MYLSFTEQELDALLMDVVQATNRGVAVTRNVSSEPNWSFGQSFFFAGTVVTTIGIKNLYKALECSIINRLFFRLWTRNASVGRRENLLHRIRIDRHPYDADAVDSTSGPIDGPYYLVATLPQRQAGPSLSAIQHTRLPSAGYRHSPRRLFLSRPGRRF